MKKQNKINRLLYSMVLIGVTMWGASSASAGTVEGTVQGLNCVLYGKVCPVDYADPHVSAENVFVVLSSKDNYFFVPNIDRAVMSRLLAQKVRITGDLKTKYNAIIASQLEVESNGKYKIRWWPGPFSKN